MLLFDLKNNVDLNMDNKHLMHNKLFLSRQGPNYFFSNSWIKFEKNQNI